MAMTIFTPSSPAQQSPNPLLYDAVKEALKNKTLHEAIDELKVAQHRLDLGLKNLEVIWVPIDTVVFKEVGGEAGSGDSSSIDEEGGGEEGATLGRSWSWNSIDEWLGQVRHATKSGFAPMNIYSTGYQRGAGYG